MEVLTYADFNEWLRLSNISLTDILERWEDRLVIGDNGIGLIGEGLVVRDTILH